MEIEQLRKEFNQLLANINEHSERFTHHEHLPALEVSVMMSKIGKLLEVATILKHTVKELEESKKLMNRVEEKAEVPIQNTPIETKEEVQIETPIVEIAQPEPIQPKIEKAASTTTEKSSIGEKFSHSPIASLKDAFSLNDRYLFANELFKKDMSLFTETVKTIDACNNLMSAQEILNQSKTNLNWDAENERVISFYQLVERRFL